MDAADFQFAQEFEPGERFFVSDPHASALVKRCFLRTVQSLWRDDNDQLVIVCIGTDRSTGDALGPLVGSALVNRWPNLSTSVFGTLTHPVHANNLHESLAALFRRWQNPFIVALDACLGRIENVGSVWVAPGAVKPGAGVNKKLPEVGNMHVTGTVNVGGFMEYFVLQNTRLSLVMSMAEVVSEAVGAAIEVLDGGILRDMPRTWTVQD